MAKKSIIDEEDWPSVKVASAGFSPRASKALLDPVEGWEPLTTMGQVARLTDRELLLRPGFGPGSLAEIDSWLTDRYIGRPRKKNSR